MSFSLPTVYSKILCITLPLSPPSPTPLYVLRVYYELTAQPAPSTAPLSQRSWVPKPVEASICFQALIPQPLKLCVLLRWSIASSYHSPQFKYISLHIFTWIPSLSLIFSCSPAASSQSVLSSKADSIQTKVAPIKDGVVSIQTLWKLVITFQPLDSFNITWHWDLSRFGRFVSCNVRRDNRESTECNVDLGSCWAVKVRAWLQELSCTAFSRAKCISWCKDLRLEVPELLPLNAP